MTLAGIQEQAQALTEKVLKKTESMAVELCTTFEGLTKDEKKQYCQLIKVSSIITGITTVFFLTIFPTLFNLALTALICVVARDCYIMAANEDSKLNSVFEEGAERLGFRDRIESLTKGTLLTGQFLKLYPQ